MSSGNRAFAAGIEVRSPWGGVPASRGCQCGGGRCLWKGQKGPVSGDLSFGPLPLKPEEFIFLKELRGIKRGAEGLGRGPPILHTWGESTRPGSPFSTCVNSSAGPQVWS